jgi:hypothetical protein
MMDAELRTNARPSIGWKGCFYYYWEQLSLDPMATTLLLLLRPRL